MFTTSLGGKGGVYFFPFNKEMQQGTGLKAGDTATMSIAMAMAEVQNDALPEDVSKAIGKHKKATAFFGTLSALQRNTYLEWVVAAKQEATGNKRIEEMIRLLTEGKSKK